MQSDFALLIEQIQRALEPLCEPVTLTEDQINLNKTVLARLKNVGAQRVKLDGLEAIEVEKLEPEMIRRLTSLIINYEVKYCGNAKEFNYLLFNRRKFILGLQKYHPDAYDQIKSTIEEIRMQRNWLKPEPKKEGEKTS